MSVFSLSFGAPFILLGLLALPVIWWLNRLTPPKPQEEPFPPLAILLKILKTEDTPAKSPWWLTLLRVLLCAAIIVALSDPILNPSENHIEEQGPVVIVLDNDWSTYADWDRRLATAHQLLDQAEDLNLPVLIAPTVFAQNDLRLGTADAARQILAALQPHPLKTPSALLKPSIESVMDGQVIGSLAVILGPASLDETEPLAENAHLNQLLSLDPLNLLIFSGKTPEIVAINNADNQSDHIEVSLHRLQASGAQSYDLVAYDQQSRPIISSQVTFEAGDTSTKAKMAAPFELLNDVLRISVEGQQQAAANFLLDDSFKRRRIAVFSGETNNVINPLLTASHYIERASQPFADQINVDNINLTNNVEQLLEQRPSAIILSDVGMLEKTVADALTKWVEDGGTLIRFAGPRLAASAQNSQLLPVILRQGERQLGGALSWSEPKALAPFEPTSPFFGIEVSTDITIKRQVLAEPSLELSMRSWANLTDGTPLVTANNMGAGRLILFHINADTNWSSLPLTGTFSEMLRRLINLSRANLAQSQEGATDETGADDNAFLPPYRVLTASGGLTNSVDDISPLEIDARNAPIVKADTRPGLYGTKDGFQAINLMAAGEVLTSKSLPQTDIPTQNHVLVGEAPQSLKASFFVAAFILLMFDAFAVLYMSGGLSKLWPQRSSRFRANGLLVLAFLSSSLFYTYDLGLASDVKIGDADIIKILEVTHIGYVITGDREVDEITELGLKGIGRYLRTRTSIEPGPPQGLDLETDELSFYPLIYWPMSERAKLPSRDAIAKIDEFMRQGGTVLFDTRDENEILGGTGRTTPRTLKLREILFGLDIPPLEPVPQDHVLTKAFYLLERFPGRFAGGELWIEALSPDRDNQNLPVYSADGVSPILITGNDFAGAWALDSDNRPVLPVSSGNERQRTLAFRTGVNIMMYMLTGNYKADQVHVPALLERLGQ